MAWHISEFPVFPVGTMDKTTCLAPSPCTVLQHYPGKLCTLNEAYMALCHTTRCDIYGWYRVNTSMVDCTTPLRIYFRHFELEKNTHKIGIFKNHSRTTADPEKAKYYVKQRQLGGAM